MGSAVRTSLALLLALPAGLLEPAWSAEPSVKEQVQRIEKHARLPFEQRERESALRALGRIGGEDAAAALLKLLDDPFEHIRDHAVSAWITMLKGDRAGETQTFLAGKAIHDRSARVRAGATVALGLTGGAELEDVFRNVVGSEKDGAVLAALATAALRLRGSPDLGGRFVKRLTHKDGAAVYVVALAAARYDGEAAVPALRKTLKHRAPLARAGAVAALQTLDALPEAAIESVLTDDAPEPAIALAQALPLRTQALPWPGAGEATWRRLLEAPSWRVRAAAIQAGLVVWEPGIVEPLLARLEAETGRLRDDVHRALETFTGQSIAPDPELWRSWWRRRKEDFDPGARPELDRGGRVPFRSGDDSAGAGDTVAFFDVPLRSKRIAFVFDLSGSMKNAATKEPNAPTKMELLQRAFERTLASLPADTKIDLLVYRYPSGYPPKPRLTRALNGLQLATPQTTRRALAWLRKQTPKGWGAFVEPIEAAMAEDVDTVVLLSDGRPSRGRLDRDFRILQEMPELNRFRQVAVNTVLIGEKGADRAFMEALAAATGGRFRTAADGP